MEWGASAVDYVLGGHRSMTPTSPTTSSDVAEVERGLRASRRALPLQIALAVIAITVAWALCRFAGLSIVLASLIAVLGSLGAVGDAVNVLVSRSRLRDLQARGESTRGDVET